MTITEDSDLRHRGGAGGHRLYERDAELEELAGVVQSAHSQKGRLAVIRGHAGIGKSALVEASLEAAELNGLRSLSARARECEHDFPFAVTLQLFEPHLRAAPAKERRQLFSGRAELARPLFEGADWHEIFNGERERLPSLLHGLFWLTANLAECSPLVLAVDDLHWGDESSLRYFIYLATRLEGLPISLVVAARQGDPSAPELLLAELCNDSRACILRPATLSDCAVKAVVEDELPFSVDERFVDACASVTKGNPFLLHELIAALVADGIEVDSATAERVLGFVPDTVIQRLLVRLGRLPGEAAALASATAIFGDDVPLHLAATLARLAPEKALDGADALAAAEIIDPRALETSRLSFVHPIVREAIYKDQPAGSRAHAHARAARLLLDQGAAAERVASHLLRAQPGTECRAVEILRAAAREAAARGVPGVAVTFLSRSLDEPLEPAEKAKLLLELAETELAASKVAQAKRHALDARDLIEHPHGRAEAERIFGRALFAEGQYRQAGEAFERGVGELSPNIRSEAARELRAAFVAVSTLDASLRERGLEFLAGIVDEAGQRPTPGERGLLAQLAAQKAIAAGRQSEVRALADRAWGEGALLSVETPEGEGWSVVTGALVWCDELEHDLEICERAVGYARQKGSPLAFATASFCRSWPLLLLGHVEESLADIEAAIAARDEGWERHIGTASWLLAHGQMERGHLDGADAALEIMAEPKLEGSVDYPILLEGRARLRLLRGEPDLALDDFLESGRRLEETFSVRTPVVAPWRAGAAIAAHRLSQRKQAHALAEANLAIARETEAPGLIGSALRTQALVVGGKHGLALLQQAVETFEPVTPRLEQVRALIDLGAALRQAGDRSAARSPLLQATAIARKGGATMLAERARVELAALGARPRKEILSGLESLTPSEKRIADLAARGLSNRQIAQELFVTVKAVEWHLHHVYQKLDIDSRKELPRVLGETGKRL
jgi:DNA-binding CsgD family transcriptional regulator